MELNIFDFSDYKTFLKTYIDKSTSRGIIKDLALAAHVHRPYLSKVLNGDIHLLPDQLYGICNFIKLIEAESEFLLLLLEKDRSNKSNYKKYIERKINNIRKAEEEKTKAYGRDTSVLKIDEDAWIYYSHWIYPMVHIAVSIPHLQRVEALSKVFEQRPERILQVLTQLLKMGFVKKEKDQWKWTQGSWHTSQSDPRTLLIHRQLRDLSHQNYQEYPKEGLYFSVVQSISENDFKELNKSIVRWIDKFNKTAAPSKPEVPVVFCCDFYQFGNNA